MQPTQTVFSGDQPATPGIYITNPQTPNYTINQPWNILSGTYVVFVEGNLAINNTLTVAPGAFLAFVVQGDITVSDTIGAAPPAATAQIQGIFITDGTFDTGTANDKQLKIEGSIIAADFRFGRNFSPATNALYPTEHFSIRPDFWVNAPREFLDKNLDWQEVAA